MWNNSVLSFMPVRHSLGFNPRTSNSAAPLVMVATCQKMQSSLVITFQPPLTRAPPDIVPLVVPCKESSSRSAACVRGLTENQKAKPLSTEAQRMGNLLVIARFFRRRGYSEFPHAKELVRLGQRVGDCVVQTDHNYRRICY